MVYLALHKCCGAMLGMGWGGEEEQLQDAGEALVGSMTDRDKNNSN